jgi:hypothetical protein
MRSFRYTPLLLERDELPELQSKEVKREITGQKEQATGDDAIRVSIGKGAPK